MIASVLLWSGVAVFGGLGAIARFELDGLVQRRFDTELPLGTLVVNGLGSFLLGVLVGLRLGGSDLLIAGVATLGSFTTFSTWMFETQRLAEDGKSGLALANVGSSIAVGLLAAGAGWWIGALL